MIYLDNNATTYPLPEVVEALRHAMENLPGNPSSLHSLGRDARRAVENARVSIAEFLGCSSPEQIIFTGSATESIRTVAESLNRGERYLLSSTEHSAVFAASEHLLPGAEVIQIPVDCNGLLDYDALERELIKGPSLMNISAANNETGVLADLSRISELCAKYHSRLHIDATQAIGRTELISATTCDFLSLSAHKLHGPKGCGILFARNPAQIKQLFGGQQEHGFRGGTENVPAIFGTGVAFSHLSGWQVRASKMEKLRNEMENRMVESIPDAQIHATSARRLPNTTNIFLPNRDAAQIVHRASILGLCISAGAACSSGGKPSHVLLAMGFSPSHANSTVRLSLSQWSTEEQILEATRTLTRIYKSMPECDAALPLKRNGVHSR
jgi:cysteine desulfurase